MPRGGKAKRGKADPRSEIADYWTDYLSFAPGARF